MEVEPQSGRQPLTGFGSMVLLLMSKHGVRYQRELLEALRASGYEVGQTRLSNWLYGRHGVALWFPEALSQALGLDEFERLELAKAFTYGQLPKGQEAD